MKGFILFEVLITFLLFSVILFSVFEFQLTSLKKTQAIYWEKMARLHVLSLLEELYSLPSGVDPIKTVMGWKERIKNTFPQGKGSYACEGAVSCVIQIQWWASQPYVYKWELPS